MWPSRMPRAASAIGSLRVVAFGEHGVERGDRAAAGDAVAAALDELRQLGEAARRIALGRRRLADRERDLALRHRVARQRIHQQQHVLAAVAEVLGDHGRVVGALHAHQRRRVGRRGDDDRAADAFLAEDVLDEFLDLAAALADQADDDHVGGGVARHHAEQHALAHAGAGEQADALAAADGQHRVDRAHAGVERRAHRVAVHRVDRPARQRLVVHLRERALAVHRLALRIDDAAEQAVADRQVQRAVDGAPPRMARGAELHRHRPATAAARPARRSPGRARRRSASGRRGRPRSRRPRRSTGGCVAGAPSLVDLADRADRHADAGGLEHQAGDAHQPALRLERQRLGGRSSAGRRGSAATCRSPTARRRCAAASSRSGGRMPSSPSSPASGGRRCGRRVAVPRQRRCRARRRRGASARRWSRRPGRCRTRRGSRRARSAASATSARAARRDRLGRAAGDERVVVGMDAHDDVARAQQQRLDRLLGDRGDALGPRAAARCAASGARARVAVAARRARHLLLQRVELLADRPHQRADLRRRLRREALLESFERDQAVAVAVLVAGLARRAQLLRVRARPDRPALPARAPARRAGRRRRAETSPNGQAANELSSSRGMKRA